MYSSSMNLDIKKATFVYLFSCNGATESGGSSVAKRLAYLTGGTVFAVKDGKVSINYSSGVASAERGGFWVRINYTGRGRYGDVYSVVRMNIKVFSPILEARS